MHTEGARQTLRLLSAACTLGKGSQGSLFCRVVMSALSDRAPRDLSIGGQKGVIACRGDV